MTFLPCFIAFCRTIPTHNNLKKNSFILIIIVQTTSPMLVNINFYLTTLDSISCTEAQAVSQTVWYIFAFEIGSKLKVAIKYNRLISRPQCYFL